MAATIQTTLHAARNQLFSITDTPTLEAALLLAYAIKKPSSYLYTWPEKKLTDTEIKTFQHVLTRRLNSEPIAYILKQKEFWSLPLKVTPQVLIPRPETETLVSAALHLLSSSNPCMVADLGTGSGAIALALASERPLTKVFAVDISSAAIAVAKQNAINLNIENVIFLTGNWCDPLPQAEFDIIVSNPPYLACEEWDSYASALLFEPKSALISGQKGLAAITEISQKATAYIKRGGHLILEHGYTQGAKVKELLKKEGYKEIKTLQDLAGLDRVTLGKRR